MRPNLVRAPRSTMAGYTPVPPFAWSGWRLRIPGGPEGGQYHGFIAPDSKGWPGGHDEISDPDACDDRPVVNRATLGDVAVTTEPWSVVWGGTVLREGQTQTDHVYRAPAEMRPRSNASGGAHVVHGFQRRRGAGFSESPGNSRALGFISVEPALHPNVLPPHNTLAFPVIDGSARYGATSAVAQPAPPTAPRSPNLVSSTTPPVSPQPSPTVAAAPSNFVPAVGQPLPPAPGAAWQPNTQYPLNSVITDPNGNIQTSTAVGTSGAKAPNFATTVGNTASDGSVVWTMSGAGAGASSITGWFSQSTLIPGVENLYIALGAGLLAYLLLKKK